jgi:hypothetical protein
MWTKPWGQMTKAEKRTAFDEMKNALAVASKVLEDDINSFLADKTTLRVDVEIKISVNPNDDPRLP